MSEYRVVEWFLAITAGLVSFFADLHVILYVLFFLILLDNMTAILRDIRKLKDTEFWTDCNWFQRFRLRIQTIRSNKLRKTGLKLVLYILFVMAVYSVEKACVGYHIYLSNLAAMIFMFSEMKSIAENIDIVLDTDIFTSVLKKIRKKAESNIEKQIGDDENGKNN